MRIDALACTDIGRVKPSNEDTFLVDEALHLYIVADGMGGHAAGEVASAVAVEEIRRFVLKHLEKIEEFIQTAKNPEGVKEILELAIREACAVVFRMGQENPEQRGMGTTVSALILTPHRGFIGHVGDSRAYLIRNDTVVQLTEDHSLINEMIKRGKLRPEDAHLAPYRNAVTRAVGVHADVQVDTISFELTRGDRFLLCSDGLVEYLFSNDEIIQIWHEHGIKDAPKAFVEMANLRGGRDNITALVAEVANLGTGQSVDIDGRLSALRRMPLFQHLEYVELMSVLNVCRLANYAPNEAIFHEGDPGTEMFVVLSGKVAIVKGGVELAKMGKGGHFGEMAIMDKGSRSADVIAVEATSLVAVGRKPLFRLMRADKDLAVKLLWCFVQVLNQRLRTTNADLQHALEPVLLKTLGEEAED